MILMEDFVAWKTFKRKLDFKGKGIFLRAHVRGSNGVRRGRGKIDQSRRGHRGD